ncbi:arsenate reductase ArsC [Polynucleobacter sp. MG-27-Goln-C1]|uniref:arsenate reductase ArsC n=1 Tax=Polynucleobacter sp. MG-27-Goln-C1 TaxID=1819726 RepID=UPI001C0C8F8D|nr:arsenate reductase ArsC [Polynucleobacter sp. MG-27-Goln-C1]MBU3611919.1 arsenate reductase ArsC [Polynucleobacter sp. MG-27-Goln-C1]
MSDSHNILFLCTGNSARSILAEALATTLSHGRFVGFSAGAKPVGKVHPIAIELIKSMSYPLQVLRSKSWDEFGRQSAPKMDFIITLCDSAVGEDCPYWPGHPSTAHWGFPDPAAVEGGNEAMVHAFKQVEIGLRNRIELLLDLPIAKLDRLELRERLQSIHHRIKFSQ